MGVIVVVVLVSGDNKVNSYSNMLKLSWVCKSEWSLTINKTKVRNAQLTKTFDVALIKIKVTRDLRGWCKQLLGPKIFNNKTWVFSVKLQLKLSLKLIKLTPSLAIALVV